MQKANKFVCASIFTVCLAAHTQTPPATTLNQAIEVVKARKTSELNATTQAYSTTPKVEPTPTSAPAPAINKKITTKNTLELWAIRGIGEDLRAEVVYKGEIKEVSFASEKIRIGNWFLVGINDKEAEFSVLNANGKLSPKIIRLKLPQSSELASIWPSPLLEGMNPTDGSSRPPVPMSMLKP